MSKKYEIKERVSTGHLEVKYVPPKPANWPIFGYVMSHRNLSQLGTCYVVVASGRRTTFGDGSSDGRPGKIIGIEEASICRGIKFPTKTIRFVRS